MPLRGVVRGGGATPLKKLTPALPLRLFPALAALTFSQERNENSAARGCSTNREHGKEGKPLERTPAKRSDR